MDDTIIIGIFTLLGTTLGFTLFKVSDILKERKEKKSNQILLFSKLFSLRSVINEMKKQTEDLNEIKKLEDLNHIYDILIKYDIGKEIPKIESLFEKSITPNIDNLAFFAKLPRLTINLNNLISIRLLNEKAIFRDDFKSNLINLLSGIIEDIDDIIKTVSKSK